MTGPVGGFTGTPGEAPDPEAVRAASRQLATLAAAIEEAAAGYEALHDDRWSGPAADAARQRLVAFTHPLRGAVDGLHTASGALAAHAFVLDEVWLLLRRADQVAARPEAARAAEARAVSTLTPAPTDTAPALETLVPALRAQAQALAQDSALRLARVLHDLAEKPPTSGLWAPRTRSVVNLDEVTAPSGDFDPSWRPRYGNPRTAEEDWQKARDDVDSVAGGHVDIILDTAGLAPGLGIAADVVHIGLDLVRGQFGDAAWGFVGTFPVLGDAVQAGRLAGRAGRHGTRAYEAAQKAVKGVDRAHEVVDKGAQLADLLPHDPPQPTGLMGAQVWARAVHDTSALARPVTGPTEPTGVRLPSENLTLELLTSPRARWTSHRPGPASILPQRPDRYTATEEVEEGGRLVTYSLEVGRDGRPLGVPRATRSRRKPPIDPEPCRVRRDGEGRFVVVPPAAGR